MYNLILPKKVKKELKLIDKKYYWRIMEAIKSLQTNPYLGKKLKGAHSNTWTYRVWPYRIIYEIQKNQLILMVLKVGHRQSVY